MKNRVHCAPLKTQVIVPALLVIVLLATAVCALHGFNAVSLRGEIKAGEYTMINAGEENLVLILDEPKMQKNTMHLSGALLRPGRNVGGVNVRVALLPLTSDETGAAETLILLNTQMVRRQEDASQYGADDHCGFYATADIRFLKDKGTAYRVVLADETEGAKHLIETDMTVTLAEGGAVFAHAQQPEDEVQYD